MPQKHTAHIDVTIHVDPHVHDDTETKVELVRQDIVDQLTRSLAGREPGVLIEIDKGEGARDLEPDVAYREEHNGEPAGNAALLD